MINKVGKRRDGPSTRLTAKQQRFVSQYQRDNDAAAALVRAGYKYRNAKSSAKKLMSNPAIQAAIAERQRAKVLAGSILRPTVQGAVTMQTCSRPVFGRTDIGDLAQALSWQTRVVADGNLDRGNAMLAVQAHTLDAIFNRLTREALNSELIVHFETYLKLALRAQSQCRATWEAISAIQNPPIAGYVRQANIAQGHQQVNNGPSPARVRENQNPQSRLLEHSDDDPCKWMDPRTPETARRTDSRMEAMGKIDGAADSRG